MPSCRSETSHRSAGSRGRSGSKGRVQFSSVSLVQNPRGVCGPMPGPSPSAPSGTFSEEAPLNNRLGRQLCRAYLPAPHGKHIDLISSAQTSLLFLAIAFSCICSFLFISPLKGDICKLQTAEKHSLGVSQSPKQTPVLLCETTSAIYPSELCDLPSSLTKKPHGSK